MKDTSTRPLAGPPAVEGSSGEDASGTCENCKASLQGRYCYQCGQDAHAPVAPLREVAARSVSEVLALDLRYPRTLRALLVPGRLPALFLSGHRVPFVPPLRLALSASLLLLLVVALRLPEAAAITADGGLGDDFGLVAREHPVLLAVIWLLTLPLFAGLLRLLFRRAAPLYLSHLTVALYQHAAFVLSLAVLFSLSFILDTETIGWIGLALLGWVVGPYLALSIRRVYAASWGRVGVGWVLAATTYLLLFGVAFGVTVGLVALLQRLGAG